MQYRDGDIIEFNPHTGMRKRYADIDENHGVIITEFVWTDQMIVANKTLRDQNANRKWDDLQQVASIPMNIFFDQELDKMLRNHDTKAYRKWLNDPDNAAWRTKEGHV